MNICFSGLNSPIAVANEWVSVFEVHNKALFARMCSSLVKGLGTDAVEPYTLWDSGDVELKPGPQFLVITSPLDLPWDDKALQTGLVLRLERLVYEDEEKRSSIESAFTVLQSELSRVALELNSDYSFDVERELKRYLRTYGFGVELSDDEPPIDKFIKFLMLAKDASLEKTLLFVNLKLFLSENDLNTFYEQAFFLGLQIMLLENVPDETCRKHERKYIIDQDLLELW